MGRANAGASKTWYCNKILWDNNRSGFASSRRQQVAPGFSLGKTFENEHSAVKRRQQCVDIVEKIIAIAVSRLNDRIFSSHPRLKPLKPGATCCRSYSAKHSPKQRNKTC